MRWLRPLLISLSMLLLAANAAAADDWTAVRLRGTVVQLVDGAWQPVHRNDVVPDDRVIRTLASGHVDFVRGTETVSLGPTTQIQIFDKGGAKPFTTVKQAFGTVTVEAEVRNVQHFAVETPYLAAVVKGTKFTVTSGPHGASVAVQRGHVEVDDKANNTHTIITVDQSASVGDGTTTSSALSVSGEGVLPAIVDSAGKIVGKANGLAKGANGLANGVANGLHGLTGTGNGNGNGNGNGGGLGLGGLGGGLGLRLGYLPEVDVAAPGLWV